ncbi:MAG: LemA family protein [Acidobacteriota bacterium]
MNKTVLGCGAVALVAFLLLGLFGAGIYNNLVGLDEGVDSAWSQVENVYQRRADLIPNLVATVQGAADFERETFQAVTEARSKVGQMRFDGAPSSEQLAAFQQNQDALTSALSRLMVVVERYPDLTATQSFRDLQAQLEGTENRIAVERRRFNEVTREYNTARRRFPAALLAGLLGFEAKAYFEAQPGSDEAPKVEF